LTKYKRDYERFIAHSEREAEAMRNDPEYFKVKVGGARLSRATRERVRILIRDINRDPLRRGAKVRGLDNLINRLIDEHNKGATMGAPTLIALHTETKNGRSEQTATVEGVS
jgi:hypothetical protein